VLTPDGTLRLSTPNLDWVILTHYHGRTLPKEEARLDCMRLNRAFHGWGHQFLYNQSMLASALGSAGFARIVSCRYGESATADLSGLERHETWDDTPDLPHVLIAEASGRGESEGIPEALLKEFREALGSH
jgi:hypothetical protein